MREYDARVVCVGPGSDSAASRVRGMLGLSFPLFGDPRLNVFSLFGYERVLAIVRQSGTVVIDRQGVVAMLHHTTNPFDALPFDEVLRALAGTTSPLRPNAT